MKPQQSMIVVRIPYKLVKIFADPVTGKQE